MGILEMSLYGAIFIMAVMIIRIVAMNHLPKRTFLVLWEMVLLRLIVPFSFPSVFSIYTLINHRISPVIQKVETTNVTTVMPLQHFVTVQSTERLQTNSLSVSVWFVTWCIGMIFFAMFFIIFYFRCRMEFKMSLPVNNACVERWLNVRTLKRQIAIRQSDRISAPLTYGIIHPVILMPKKTDWENVNQLQYIFAHEYVHICRFDAFIKLVAVFALCIHWFNPFVWAMYILFNRDMEFACDESVIRQFGEKSRAAYSHMLIDMEVKKCGLSAFYSYFSRNVIEERITVIMRTKRINYGTVLMACLIVFITAGLFATSAVASDDDGQDNTSSFYTAQSDKEDTGAEQKSAMTVVHESADILYYEDGAPYIHDVLTNNTDRTVTETRYGMLAYNENGLPLKLHWNFLDSSAESSFDNLVWSKKNIFAGQTENYRGGWSLYDGEVMKDFPKVGDGGANQVAYSLLCLMQVVFEDGTVWNNPDYEKWFQTYAGNEISVDELQNYYPHEYKIEFD